MLVYRYVPCYLGAFSPIQVYQWVDNCHRPMCPNCKIGWCFLFKYIYFFNLPLKISQLEQTWVFFCEKWCSEGLQNCICLGIKKVKIVNSAWHIPIQLEIKNPPASLFQTADFATHISSESPAICDHPQRKQCQIAIFKFQSYVQLKLT